MNIDYAPKIHGLPDEHEGPLPQYYQGNTNECAIYAQWNVLRDYGIDVDESTLVEQAKARGWFSDEGGTPIEHMGKLLELNGVPCDMMVDGNRYNLINELAQGKRVIVTVDASELWRENSAIAKLLEGVKDIFGSGEDHAIVVSGVDTSDPENIQVVLTDSGTGHRTISYPIDQFEDAWTDGGCKMIVTHNPPPENIGLPSMINFDYESGHIAKIGDSTYDVWKAEHTEDINDCVVTTIHGLRDGDNDNVDMDFCSADVAPFSPESNGDIDESNVSDCGLGENVEDICDSNCCARNENCDNGLSDVIG